MMVQTSTFEITIEQKSGNAWPVVAIYGRPGALDVRNEGRLRIDRVALTAKATPQEYGTLLGQALFRDDVREAFVRARAASEDHLRVLLSVEANELKVLRWERLCAPLDGGWSFLALDQRVPFSQYLPSQADRNFPPIGERDLCALLVVASPEGIEDYGLSQFDVSKAVTCVQAALQGIPTDVLANDDGAMGPPTLDALCERITAGQYTLLQIISHGRYHRETGDTILFLADANKHVNPITGTQLLERLGRLRGRRGLPRFTFLASCESASPEAEGALGGLAQRLVRELGMPAALAMTETVSVETAEALAEGFYRQLRVHGEVDRALAEACAGLADRHDITVPALYSRLGSRPLFEIGVHPPTAAGKALALDQVAALLPQRAPCLQGEFGLHAKTLRSTLDTEESELSPAACCDRQKAETEINKLCVEALDLSFDALAQGHQPPPYDDRCPFRGLFPFRAEDQAFFFGREALIERLSARLAEHRVLAVLGPSGSGKSSLVLAGLIPALQKERPSLQMRYMTPGTDPLSQLATALGGSCEAADPQAVLVVDQFEELFTLCTEEARRGAFLDRLLSLAKEMRVVLTMRADFWGECAPYRELAALMQAEQELIAPMGSTELRSAIEQQAAAVGLRFEADLANTILDDVRSEPGAMPLLQHALLELWSRRHGRWLQASEYRSIGGVQRAIARTADEVYDTLTADEQDRVRDIFTRLTRLDEDPGRSGERRDTRRRLRFAELVPADQNPGPSRDLVKRLADARLVVTSVNQATGAQEVEIAHEALIRYWPRLQDWLNENRDLLRLRQRIGQDAQRWHDGGRQGELLPRWNAELDEAIILARRHRFVPTKLEQDYLDACIALRDRESAAKEAQRQRERQLARRVIIVLASGVVIALALAGVAARLAVVAEGRRQEALINETEAWTELARQQLRVDPVASLTWITHALPSASIQRPYVPKAEYVLRTAFQTGAERQYRKASASLDPRQIGLEGPSIATGGDGLRLINHDLTGDPIELEKPDQPVNEVAWRDDGALVSHGDSDISIWQQSKRIAAYDFGFGSPIACAIWRPIHREVALCSGSSLWLWPDGELRPTRIYTFSVPFNPAGLASPASWSPNGRWLAAWDRDNALFVWDAQSREKALITDHAPGNRIWEVAWSPDNQHILAINADGTARIWRLGAEPTLVVSTTVAQSPTSASEVAGASFINPERFLTWGFGGKAAMWSLDGHLVRAFDPQDGRIHGAKLLAEAGGLLTFMDNGNFYLWDLETGSKTGFSGHTQWVVSADWNGRYLATGAADGTVRIWNPAGGAALMTLRGHTTPTVNLARADVVAVQWQEGGRLLTGGLDGTLRIWQVLDDHGVPLCSGSDAEGYARCHGEARTLPDLVSGTQDARWLDDDTILASSEDGFGYRWNLASGAERVPVEPSDGIRHVLWNRDGARFFTYASAQPNSDDAQPGVIWNASTGARVAVDGPIDVAFWLDGGLLVGAAGNAPRLVDPAAGRTRVVLREQRADITDAQASGKRLATADVDGTIRIWDLETGRLRSELRQSESGMAPYLEWSADGRHLLGAGSEVVLWDVETKTKVWTSQQSGQAIRPMFSPDGSHVAGGIDSTAYVWDAKTGAEVWSSSAHGDQIHGIQWTRGARWDGPGSRPLLLTWGGDGTARVWDWEKKTEIMRHADPESISYAVVNASGSRLLTVNSDGALRVWEVWLNDPVQLLAAVQAHITRPNEGPGAASGDLGARNP